ncbi:MAG: MaoC family dehydratase [Ferrimonas sp.]
MSFVVGQHAEISKTFGEKEVLTFSELSEDRNPVHLDSSYAANTPFKRPIVHGMLLSSLLSALLGQHLPGAGTIYLGQTLKFIRPVYVGDPVTAKVTISEIRPDKPIITLTTEVFDKDGHPCVQGEAVVRI